MNVKQNPKRIAKTYSKRHMNNSSILECSSLSSQPIVPLFDIFSGQDQINSRINLFVGFQEGSVSNGAHEEFNVEKYKNKSTQKPTRDSPQYSQKYLMPRSSVELLESSQDISEMKQSPSYGSLNERKLRKKSGENIENLKEIYPRTNFRRSARLHSPKLNESLIDLSDKSKIEESYNGLGKKKRNKRINDETTCTEISGMNTLTIFDNIIYTRSSRRAIFEGNDRKHKNVDKNEYIHNLDQIFPFDKICEQKTNFRKGRNSSCISSIPIINNVEDYPQQKTRSQKNGIRKNVVDLVSAIEQAEKFQPGEIDSIPAFVSRVSPIDQFLDNSENVSNKKIQNFNKDCEVKFDNFSLKNGKVNLVDYENVSVSVGLKQSPTKRGRGRPRKRKRKGDFNLGNTKHLVTSNIETPKFQTIPSVDSNPLQIVNNSETSLYSETDCGPPNKKPLRKSDRLKTKCISTEKPTNVNSNTVNCAQADSNEQPADTLQSFPFRNCHNGKKTEKTNEELSGVCGAVIEKTSKTQNNDQSKKKHVHQNTKISSNSPRKTSLQVENFTNKENIDEQNSIVSILDTHVLDSESTSSVSTNTPIEKYDFFSTANGVKGNNVHVKLSEEAELSLKVSEFSCLSNEISRKSIRKSVENSEILGNRVQTNGSSMEPGIENANFKECENNKKQYIEDINEFLERENGANDACDIGITDISLMQDVFTTKDEKNLSMSGTSIEENKLEGFFLNSERQGKNVFNTSDSSEEEMVKINCLDNHDFEKSSRIDSSLIKNSLRKDIKKGDSCDEMKNNFSDFGYDTHRRSFRLLLENVKKLSIIEAEENRIKSLRLQRCKSVPHEEISFKSETNIPLKIASRDKKFHNFKQISPLKTEYPDEDFQPIRRGRAKSLCTSKFESLYKKSPDLKIKSLPSVSDGSMLNSPEIPTKQNPLLNREGETEQSYTGSEKKNHVKADSKSPTGQSKEPSIKINQHQLEGATISAKENSLSVPVLDEGDLEVQKAQLVGSLSETLENFHPIRRTRSFSQVSELNIDKKVSPLKRPKSVIGRSRKNSRKALRRSKSMSNLRRNNFTKDSTETTNIQTASIKDLKIGDIVWGKLGTYPYWPCIIVSDPETSEYRKFKLLRSMPYYHVRFFGDKGRRAWTTHVLPYTETDDLDNFAKQHRQQGISASSIKGDFVIKNSQRKKWERGVAEAELLKNEPLEKKMNFFNEILSNDSSNLSLSSKVSSTSDESSLSKQVRTRRRKRIKSQNENISLQESSVDSSINAVVNRYSSWDSENSSDDNVPKRRSSLKQKKRRRISHSENNEYNAKDSILGFELLDLPSFESGALETYNSQITDTKDVINESFSKTSPSRSSRSRSRVDHQRDQLQASNLEVSSIKHPFTPPKTIERKQADQFDSESGISEQSLNYSSSFIPQLKKNLFRGVPREKVCQICEKSGHVVKCRGPCYGDYHISCVEKSFKSTNEQNNLKNMELQLNNAKNEQVQIITVTSRKKTLTPKLKLSPMNRKLTLTEQIDQKMKEVMKHVESQSSEFLESTDSSGEELIPYEKGEDKSFSKNQSKTKSKNIFKHVTADDVSIIRMNDEAAKEKVISKTTLNETAINGESYKCLYCISSILPPCFVCNNVISTKGNDVRQRCSVQKCGRFYHLGCLKKWPQTQWSFMFHENKKSEAFDSFVCPRHVCHMCASENVESSKGTHPSDTLVKCLKCPATYHNSHHCIPAGTQILTSAQIICPRHEDKKKSLTCNAVWCFVCSEGGNLICCETCPTSVHAECLPVNLLDDNTYLCEDCECGRFPLYDELVWVKCGTFRWWPAIILFPNEIPANILAKPHKRGEFVVKFFGTYDFLWAGRGRTFLYQEGDTGYLYANKSRINNAFGRALKEVAEAYRSKKESKSKRVVEVNNRLKPPPYVRIKINRPVGNVKVFEGNLSNTTSCDCDPNDSNPCGPNSNCLNRILLTECNPEVCPAGQKCRNRRFETREYPQVIPYRTGFRGWGLKTLEPIKKGQFVIEYVGEIIDDEEYERRIKRMHQLKDENYYFLTIDRDRMLDAGPKGNAARFMNHSCQPNCETQKWTVNGDTRVGLFAIEDIPADTELTFNYNLECVGTEKKICRCGASNCSGYIGVKPEDQTNLRRYDKKKNKKPKVLQTIVESESCVICKKQGDTLKCSKKSCLKSYHWKCVQMDQPEPGNSSKDKWTCPSHNCKVCSKRATRNCVQCINSYCPSHSEGNLTHDVALGYLCSEHELEKRQTRSERRSIKRNAKQSTTYDLSSDVSNFANTSSSRSERYRKRRGSNTGSEPPQKKPKLNSV